MSNTSKSQRIDHDPEFKKQAVQMLNTSGRPVAVGANQNSISIMQDFDSIK